MEDEKRLNHQSNQEKYTSEAACRHVKGAQRTLE
jgi:hypothetical protein